MAEERAIRTCCIGCPDWPVVVARRTDPSCRDVPTAVLEPPGSNRVGTVRAASPEARAQGVVPGLRRREAEARCPGLVVHDTDAAAEARAFEVLARAVEVMTPRVALDRPGRMTFPTRGPSRYFGGDDALVARLHDAIVDAGLADVPVHIGIADSRFAAGLAARRDVVVAAGETASFLADWPVRVLGDPDLADLLSRLGLRTLGAFAALPPAAVLARFGPVGHDAHRLARGLDLHPPVLAPPPPELVETHEFEPPAERVDVATFAAKTMADRLLDALAARGLACTQVIVEAETEHGEQTSRCWRHDRALTPAALAERVRWQLEGWLAASERAVDDELLAADAVTAGLTKLRLVPDEVVPAVGRQLGFWGGDAAAADRAARAFARVQGLLGPDAVVSPVVQGGRTPAERVRWVPWGEPREPARPGAADPGMLAGPEQPAGVAVAVAPSAGCGTDARYPSLSAASEPDEPAPDGDAGTTGARRQPAPEVAPWPGAVPPPAPACTLQPPAPVELLDGEGTPVRVSARGDASGAPAVLRTKALPGGGGTVVGWAGPWLHDVRWWDAREHRRQARWQLVVRAGGAGAVDVACLVVLERGRAFLEAIYD
jgi:protein ImuB